MKRMVCSVGGALLAISATSVMAENEWKGEAELGLVSTTGNTETQSLNVKMKAVNERDRWRHKLRFESLYGESANTTTAERYFASAETNYKLSELDYVFGIVNYEADRFSGYDYRASEAVGYGRRVIKQENLTLDLEAGPGARQSKRDDGTKTSEALLRLSGSLAWKINDHAALTEDLSSEVGEDVTITKSVTGLKAQIDGNLAMKLTYTAKNTSSVPVGIKKTDTETAVTLVYGF